VRPSFRPLAAFAVLLLLLVGCGDASPGGDAAATVDGEPIPRSQLEEAVRGLTTDAPEDDREAAVAETQRQVLTLLIQARIIENLADAEDIEIDEADVEERYETDVEQAGGEEAFEGMLAMQSFTLELYRDVLVPTQLRVDVMRQRLAGEEPPYEARTVRHILVETEDEATEILDELEGGADFAELAEERSIDTGSGAQGGELGEFGRGQMVPEFEEAVFTAEIGEVVGPVETQFGFHVIEVIERAEPDLEEVEEEIRVELAQARQGEVVQEWLTERRQEADIEVNPRFGEWDATTGQVISSAGPLEGPPGAPQGDPQQAPDAEQPQELPEGQEGGEGGEDVEDVELEPVEE
jgi:parvulin-like peptidyl-prolyl isomerase